MNKIQPKRSKLLSTTSANKVPFRALDPSSILRQSTKKQSFEVHYVAIILGAWRGPLNHYREMFSYQSCLWMSEAQLRVRIPTLLIFGKNDSVFDSKLKHQCSKHVDHLECYTIDRASHWVHREEPEQFHKLLAKFLNVIV